MTTNDNKATITTVHNINAFQKELAEIACAFTSYNSCGDTILTPLTSSDILYILSMLHDSYDSANTLHKIQMSAISEKLKAVATAITATQQSYCKKQKQLIKG